VCDIRSKYLCYSKKQQQKKIEKKNSFANVSFDFLNDALLNVIETFSSTFLSIFKAHNEVC
jgi:hypothetical protein